MERTPLEDKDSRMIGNLRSVGYDSEKNILEIEYNLGFIYQYYSVPKEMFDKLMSERNKIVFVQERIAKQYRSQRIK
ncbi:MAG: KTSC domain-containing protein [Candidatus ainarchaeum sp.]|nr:KTSC domain-containing protein [Candidatus ainarchaeum sp.]